MSIIYAILGTGRQGTAAAYDMARFGEAERVYMADADAQQAAGAAARVNRLIGQPIAEAATLDAGDPEAVARWLKEHGVQVFVSGVPYFLNLGLTQAAIQAGASMVDFGGNSEVVFAQMDLHQQAAQAGLTVIPDCGLSPGMSTTLALYAMEQLDQAQDVYIWDCGLPQHPEPPWNYRLTFSIEGLTNEYHGYCVYIRDGRETRVPALEELEIVQFPEPIGELEAFTTAGGVTSAARTFAGRLRTLQNKTMRYPGHFAQLKVIQQLGMLELEPIEVDGCRIKPRHVLHALWEPQIRAEAETRDLAIIRVLAKGSKGGKPAEAQVDLIFYFDERTGFTAMEQGTGWHAAIMAEAIAAGEVAPGVIPVEEAMSGGAFVERAGQRGFQVQVTLRDAGRH